MKKIEKHLKETVDEIKPTNEESFAFHRQHHVHTIANSEKIVSVVMLGGEKISEIELKHPYNNRKIIINFYFSISFYIYSLFIY